MSSTEPYLSITASENSDKMNGNFIVLITRISQTHNETVSLTLV